MHPQQFLTQKKDMFYENLNRAINESGTNRIIGGDFNARIYNVHDNETEYIGNNIIYRAEGHVLNCMSKESKKNRDMFINTLKTHKLIATNTWLDKPEHKRVTYMEKYIWKKMKHKTDHHTTSTHMHNDTRF